jgi:glycerol-3-phosphate acyltransferase PlsY
MPELLKILAAFASGYALGSLNAALVVGRLWGTDIRREGSGNAGLTNALRVLGRGAAALVLAGDVLKGVLACLIGLRLGVLLQAGAAVDDLGLLAAGAGAVIGHNWPLWFGFRGGKGALTGLAVLFMLDWRMAAICLGLFALLVALTRYVSLGTLSATLCFLALAFLPGFGHGLYFQLFAGLMAVIVILRHRENIGRLVAGTENRLAF